MPSFHENIGDSLELSGLCGVQNALGVLDQAIQNTIQSS